MQGRIRLAALLLAVPIGAAAGPSYTYLQGERIADGKTELDGTADVRLDGYAAEASFALGERGFFRIDYSGIELNFFETDVDRWGMGFGAIKRENDHVDLYGMLSYERLEVDSEDGDGYGLTGGMRITPASWLEINPSLGYVNYGEVGDFDVSGLRYAFRLVFNATEHLGIVAAFEGTDFNIDQSNVNNDPDFDLKKEWRIGARLNF